MAVRTGMNELIIRLRGMTHTANDDYTIYGLDYWSGEQLQEILDHHRVMLNRYIMTRVPQVSAGGAVAYFDHEIDGYGNFEQTTGGSAIFFIEDAAGNDQGTALWTPDYNVGRVTFASDTGGTVMYVTGRSYDLNGAAAEVWRQKMGHFAANTSSFDFSTDNMSVKRSQRIDQAKEMINLYAGQARPKMTTLFRSDN